MDLLWHGKDQTRPAEQHCGIWGFCSTRRGRRSPGKTPNIIKGQVTPRAQSPQGMANPIQNPLTFWCGFHGSEASLGLSCEMASVIRDRRSRLALLRGSTKGGRRAKACPQLVLCSGIKHKVLGSRRRSSLRAQPLPSSTAAWETRNTPDHCHSRIPSAQQEFSFQTGRQDKQRHLSTPRARPRAVTRVWGLRLPSGSPGDF